MPKNEISIVSVNPVAGSCTTYSVRIKSNQNIPLNSIIEIKFPAKVQIGKTDKVTGQRNFSSKLKIYEVNRDENIISLSCAGAVEIANEGEADSLEADDHVDEKRESKAGDDDSDDGTDSKPSVLLEAGQSGIFVLNKITNPKVSGNSGSFEITICDETTGATLQSFRDIPGFEVQPGEMMKASCCPDSTVIDKVTNYTVEFISDNPVPLHGTINVQFDRDFGELHCENEKVEALEGFDGLCGAELTCRKAADGRTIVIYSKGAGPATEGESKVGDSDKEQDDATFEDSDDEENDKEKSLPGKAKERLIVQGGKLVRFKIRGVTNPGTPGVRKPGARQDRIYKIWTRAGKSEDEESKVSVDDDADAYKSNCDGFLIDEILEVRATKFTTSVVLKTLMQYLFPPKQQHPSSTGRLFVFGMYGPLDKQGYIRGGKFGTHRVSESELKTMVSEIFKEDITSIYTDDINMTMAQRNEIVAKASPMIKDCLSRNFTKTEILQMCKDLPRDDAGGLSFHDLQAMILRIRAERLTECRLMTRKKEKVELKRKKKKKGNKKKWGEIEKIHDTEAFKVMHKMLHRKAFQITSVGEGTSPSIVQNVRILRERYEGLEMDEPWNKF
eukprot:g4336.t1